MLARTESCKVCAVDSNDSARSLSDRRCTPVEYRRGKKRLFSGREKERALHRETKRAKLESRRSNRSLLTRFPIANYASSTTNNKQRRCCAPLILVTSYLSSTREYFVISTLRNRSFSPSLILPFSAFLCLCFRCETTRQRRRKLSFR